MEFLPGADAELGEDLAQVPFDRTRADEQLGARILTDWVLNATTLPQTTSIKGSDESVPLDVDTPRA